MAKGRIKHAIGNAELEPGQRLYQPQVMNPNRDEKYTRNSKEDLMLSLIDQKRNFHKLIKLVESLKDGKQDVVGALDSLAPEMLLELAAIAFDPKESNKIRLSAIQDWLDRAGYSKVQKHTITPVDASTPREAILALIAGKTREVEIVDDSADEQD